MQMPTDIMIKCWTQMKNNLFSEKEFDSLPQHIAQDKIVKLLKKKSKSNWETCGNLPR